MFLSCFDKIVIRRDSPGALVLTLVILWHPDRLVAAPLTSVEWELDVGAVVFGYSRKENPVMLAWKSL